MKRERCTHFSTDGFSIFHVRHVSPFRFARAPFSVCSSVLSAKKALLKGLSGPAGAPFMST